MEKKIEEVFEAMMDSQDYIKLSHFLEVKRYGNTQNIEVICSIPNSPEGILVLQSDCQRLADFFLYADKVLNKPEAIPLKKKKEALYQPEA